MPCNEDLGSRTGRQVCSYCPNSRVHTSCKPPPPHTHTPRPCLSPRLTFFEFSFLLQLLNLRKTCWSKISASCYYCTKPRGCAELLKARPSQALHSWCAAEGRLFPPPGSLCQGGVPVPRDLCSLTPRPTQQHQILHEPWDSGSDSWVLTKERMLLMHPHHTAPCPQLSQAGG